MALQFTCEDPFKAFAAALTQAMEDHGLSQEELEARLAQYFVQSLSDTFAYAGGEYFNLRCLTNCKDPTALMALFGEFPATRKIPGFPKTQNPNDAFSKFFKNFPELEGTDNFASRRTQTMRQQYILEHLIKPTNLVGKWLSGEKTADPEQFTNILMPLIIPDYENKVLEEQTALNQSRVSENEPKSATERAQHVWSRNSHQPKTHVDKLVLNAADAAANVNKNLYPTLHTKKTLKEAAQHVSVSMCHQIG